MDFLVTAERVRHGGTGAGEGRGIQNDEVKLRNNSLVRLCGEHPIHVEFRGRGFSVSAGGHEVDDATLQSNEVTAIVSTIAKHPHVREAMVREQRRIADDHSVVMVGRDIGTVVLPKAPVKIFLTASVLARVE